MLAPRLELVDLPLWTQLDLPRQPIKHVFFPESGIISVLAFGAHRREIEVGLIGREGMTGSIVVMGNDRSLNLTVVQLAGRAQRLGADELRSAMQAHRSIQEVFLHYVQALMTQAEQTAVANATSSIERRLARWLLMAHDRVDGDEVAVTHETLARMLGAHRPAVTVALHALEARRLLAAARGRITILKRKQMMEFAGPSYGVLRRGGR